MEKGSLSGSSALISIWVKIGAFRKTSDREFPESWIPEPLSRLLGANEVAFPGGSYHREVSSFGDISQPPHIWSYPFPGPQSSGPLSWKTEITPIITFGKADLPFKRVAWEKRKLNDVWVFGKGGVPQALMAQHPVRKEDEFGYVPPSCIGIRNGELRIVLQTGSNATYKGCAWAQSRSETIHIMTPYGGNPFLGEPVLPNPKGWKDYSTELPTQPNSMMGFNLHYEDVSSLECGQHPEAFIMDTGVGIGDGHWHHILLSYDLSGKSAGRKEGSDGGESKVPLIRAAALGPPGDKPLPGTWGQYSGADGPNTIAQPRYLLEPGYAGKAAYGRPFEDVGEFGPANAGEVISECRAWLVVDGRGKTGAALNHEEAYAIGGQYLIGGDHAIAPPNAFLVAGSEIRNYLTTNLTGWERDYRTLLGGFRGPAAIIDPTNEKRRFDYERASYEFNPGGLAGGPLALPAGRAWLDEDLNSEGMVMAELQIWNGKYLDLDNMANVRLFLTGDGRPEEPRIAEEALGPPDKKGIRQPLIGKSTVQLHWSVNWRHGRNHGQGGERQTGPGSGTDAKTVPIPSGNFQPVGKIDRVLPNPAVGG